MVHVNFQQREIGVVEAFGEPGFKDGIPKFLVFGGIAHEFGGAGDRHEVVVVRVGVGEVDARVLPGLLRFGRVHAGEKPEVTVEFGLLGRHGAAAQPALGMFGGEHRDLDVFNEFPEVFSGIFFFSHGERVSNRGSPPPGSYRRIVLFSDCSYT